MNILVIGDVVSSKGCEFLRSALPSFKKVKGISPVIFGVGALFIGMMFMSDAMKPLRNWDVFTNALKAVSNPLVAVLISVPPLGNEPMTIWQLLGGALILGFTLLNEIPTKKKRGCQATSSTNSFVSFNPYTKIFECSICI